MEEIRALLLEFERCHRSGTRMDAAREAEFETLLRDRLRALYFEHADEAPIRDPQTGHVYWRREAEIAKSPTLRQYWDAYIASLDICELSKSLDRMLREGMRRNRLGKYAPPRIAEQVSRRLTQGQPINDPVQLIDDCWKYALREETHLIVRRARSKTGRARTRKQPRVRKADAKSLARTLGNHELQQLSKICPIEFGFVLAYEFQMGGLSRESLASFVALPLGNSTLGAVLDAIEERFEAIDAATRSLAGATKCRPAALVGMTAREFAAILASCGVQLQPSSLPRVAKRRRDHCLQQLLAMRR
jgi:hypothetical protein